MTSAIPFPAYVIGLMSGTSADGVDAALLYTDGREIVRTHESLFMPYDDALRADILALMRGRGDAAAVAGALTQVHIDAVRKLLSHTSHPVSLIGFHGQTIYHAPHEGVTVQIGDAHRMVRELGIPVVADFRSNDVRNGGQGAPLVPLYHAALSAALEKPVMVVNIGGVANVTWVGEQRDRLAFHGEPEQSERRVGAERTYPEEAPLNILAFDCGPGNALIDDWVARHTSGRYDIDGQLAARGVVDEAAVATFMQDAFFARPAPKSLDRNHFKPVVAGSVEDGAATLTAMTAAAIAAACRAVPQPPKRLLLTGGGRLNPVLVRMIEERSGCQVALVDSLGWNGDMLEAEAFAYLAARSVQGLPLSLPGTTSVRQPVTGGVFYPAAGAGGC